MRVSQDRGRDEGLAPALSRAFGSVIWVAFVSYSLLPLLATVLFSVSEGWVNTVFPERLSVLRSAFSRASISCEPRQKRPTGARHPSDRHGSLRSARHVDPYSVTKAGRPRGDD